MSGPQKRPLSPADGTGDDGDIFSSSPILDRSSTFVAHFHPLTSSSTSSTPGQATKQASLTSTVKAFQSHADFASADHRMVAWRRPSAQRTLGLGPATSATKPIYTVGSDDDGEKYAGKRLERVLIDLDAEGVVVVARWYGGILLGPVRFTHIEMVAREAIGKWKSRQEGQAKRQKTIASSHQETPSVSGPSATDEAHQQAKLAKQLVERDSSIVVLRGLLAEKTAKLQEGGETSSQATSTPTTQPSMSPAKKIDYSEMPLQRLRQLDKARDATIAFILKQIDLAEEEEKNKNKKREGDTKEDTPEKAEVDK
ncbi:hypothetical protein PV08_08403 [Exophiala spinifera]|uniref:Impact N-terminal domain-containing protein n=1 Tax=Exophiala spinifera TaxID=91928 RepID=A0A0D1YDT2_9EURO|nr:uncharacterized protein PV08_08403 [Exophiala spinifera]KIW13216.1 hypothetical protein PV08_08403 [Exophiala spinifera]